MQNRLCGCLFPVETADLGAAAPGFAAKRLAAVAEQTRYRKHQTSTHPLGAKTDKVRCGLRATGAAAAAATPPEDRFHLMNSEREQRAQAPEFTWRRGA